MIVLTNLEGDLLTRNYITPRYLLPLIPRHLIHNGFVLQKIALGGVHHEIAVLLQKQTGSRKRYHGVLRVRSRRDY